MSILGFISKYFFPKKILFIIVNNIFNYSSLNFGFFLQSMNYKKRISFMRASLLSVGIGYQNNNPLKAETWLIQNVLKFLFENRKDVKIFDIGANVGELTFLLNKFLPYSEIYSFEPNPITCQILQEKFKNMTNIHVSKIGFSSKEEAGNLYTYRDDKISQHASVIKEVFTDLHHTNSIISFEVKLKTLDSYVFKKNITKIDYLKIDTEGYELDILKGGLNFIKSGGISIIQFEFNEMNILRRVFLRDFFELLANYKIFRLAESGLIDISEYKSEYEIFWYQDILCVLKKDLLLMSKIEKYICV